MATVTSSLREIFADAAEIADPSARAAFLEAACKGDPALRQRVERLLAADSNAGNFLRPSGDTTTSALVTEKPGDRIGRYRLLERIGRGGGGVVYLAEQVEPVRRRVALKILKAGIDTESVVARFELERQTLALMDHPNIARVLDAGATETGRPFFVMELVSGERLSDYCERHHLSLRQRLELFIPVCQAVQHAHQKGIIHRDLKPSNILVTEHEGVAAPKVIDFGIAKATQQGLNEQAGLTSVNQFLGTPAYMSPEQMELGGRDIDTRTDIYSLGVILYELITDQPPFDVAGAGFEEMRRLIREVDPLKPSTRITRKLLSKANIEAQKSKVDVISSRRLLQAVRGDLDWVVMKCLEKDRTRRYATANGLATDIRRHLDNEPVVARPPTGFYRLQKVVRRHRVAFGAVSVVVFVLVAAVIISTQLALRARRAEREQTRLRGLAEASARESRQRLIRRYVAEGNRLLEQNRPAAALPWMVEALDLETGDLQREADERLRIAQTLIGAPELRLHLSQGKSINSVALSPDGSRLATGSDDGQVRISEIAGGGGTSTNLTLPGAVGRLRFSPDGSRLVAMDLGGHARVWDAASGQTLTPLLQPEDFSERLLTDLARQLKPAASFSADGKLLLLAGGAKSAQLRDAVTGSLLRQFPHGHLVYHAAFSPDARLAATSSQDGTARVWDVATGRPAGPPLHHDGPVAWAQFSSDGNKLMTVRERHFVQLWDWRAGRRLAPEIPRRSVLYHASLSPDGSRILTTAWSGYAHLYDASSSLSVYEFQQQGGVVDAAFSPDGRHVATACEDGNAWLWTLADAVGHPLLLPQGNHIEEIAFNAGGAGVPAGRFLAVAGRGGHARVWDLSPPQPGVRRLPGDTVEWVVFDQSARRALLLSTDARSGIKIFDVPTGNLLGAASLKLGGSAAARFSPDGRRIVLFGNGSAALVLEADSARQLCPPLAHTHRVDDALWTPDSKFILTAAGPAGAQAWDPATGRPTATFPHANSVSAIAISSDGKQLAIAQAGGAVEIWETLACRRQAGPIMMPGTIHQLEFSPDGARLAIAAVRGTDGVVEVRDIATGAVIGRPLLHRDAVRAFQFSRDGRWLATACDDHTARVWEAATGEPVSPWLPHDFEVRQVEFSPDGTRLATLTRRGAFRLWCARTGEPITAPLQYERNAGTGRFSYSPDGQRLLICRGGNEAWLRELQPETASLEELRLLAEVLSCTRFDPAAGMVPLDESSLDEAWKQLGALRKSRQSNLSAKAR